LPDGKRVSLMLGAAIFAVAVWYGTQLLFGMALIGMGWFEGARLRRLEDAPGPHR
jgi:hypothetical protein